MKQPAPPADTLGEWCPVPSAGAAAPRRPTLPATIAVLAIVAAAGWFGPTGSMLVAGPLGTAALLLLARIGGLSAADLGLDRRSWRAGAGYAAAAVASVAVVYALAATLPATRPAFLDQRYRTDLAAAARAAFVVVPLGTVLFEEVAFRGVLWGAVRRRRTAARASAVSSVLFGLWHIVPSLRLNQVNPAVADLTGPGRVGQLLTVAGAVVVTGLAGAVLCELRRRSGSLLAPIGLHWATNGLGVLFSASVAP